ERHQPTSWLQVLFLPWMSTVFMAIAALIVGWEGVICVAMALPILLPMASLGGWLGRLSGRWLFRRLPPAAHSAGLSLLLLPFLYLPGEQMLPPTTDIRTVDTHIDIAASPSAIWQQIKSVPTIQPREQVDSFIYRIGFPHPLAATLSYDGVGGVREA